MLALVNLEWNFRTPVLAYSRQGAVKTTKIPVIQFQLTKPTIFFIKKKLFLRCLPQKSEEMCELLTHSTQPCCPQHTAQAH